MAQTLFEKPVWLESNNLELLGFEVIEDKGTGYLKLQNNGKILWNPDYNPDFPESRGKVKISINPKLLRQSNFSPKDPGSYHILFA